MAKFRKQPVVIEAFRLGEDDPLEWWMDAVDCWQAMVETNSDGHVEAVIATLEGPHYARGGDWIVRGVKGELYPVKSDIFALTYEPAEG